MMLRKWDDLPPELRTEEVRPYYDVLAGKRGSLVLKRVFDIAGSLILLILLSPLFLALSIAVKADSPGPVFFRQTRVTHYGRKFKIFKFRTMVANAEKLGTQVTADNDSRITRVGQKIRDYRLDEIPQLLNVLSGDMSFVGTRPEVPRYVERYTPEMMATLLLPAGVTSLASIKYKDEARLLAGAEDTDDTYVNKVLPGKMVYNLQAVEEFGFWRELGVLWQTVFAVLRKEEEE